VGPMSSSKVTGPWNGELVEPERNKDLDWISEQREAASEPGRNPYLIGRLGRTGVRVHTGVVRAGRLFSGHRL
jgi:hypothetical protein